MDMKLFQIADSFVFLKELYWDVKYIAIILTFVGEEYNLMLEHVYLNYPKCK